MAAAGAHRGSPFAHRSPLCSHHNTKHKAFDLWFIWQAVQLRSTQPLWVAGLLIFSTVCVCLRWWRFVEKTCKEFPTESRGSVCALAAIVSVKHISLLLLEHTRKRCPAQIPSHPQIPEYLFHKHSSDNTLPLPHCLFVCAGQVSFFFFSSLGKNLKKTTQ